MARSWGGESPEQVAERGLAGLAGLVELTPGELAHLVGSMRLMGIRLGRRGKNGFS